MEGIGAIAMGDALAVPNEKIRNLNIHVIKIAEISPLFKEE